MTDERVEVIMPRDLPELPLFLVDGAVRAGLAEDLGRAGDITSAATIPADAKATAAIVARKPGVLAGLALAERAFRLLDPGVSFAAELDDGDELPVAAVVAQIAGNARAILSAERVALNFLCHLSGIATATAGLASQDRPYQGPASAIRARRCLACGRSRNTRSAAVAASTTVSASTMRSSSRTTISPWSAASAEAIRLARARAGHLVKIEVEVDTLEQLAEAIAAGPDAILLDNMPPDELRTAVRMVGGRAVTEASGGITPDTIAAIAETGVDMISSGWLTHSAPALDLALDVAVQAQKKKR